MKNKRIILVCGMVLGMCLLMLQNGCYYDKEDKLYPITAACDTASISYIATVKPIISANCYSCHGASVYISKGGGYNLEDYATLANQVNNGQLVCDIKHAGCNDMPEGAPKMSDCNITKIEAWKKAGTPNN